jgi:hypothetical protein
VSVQTCSVCGDPTTLNTVAIFADYYLVLAHPECAGHATARGQEATGGAVKALPITNLGLRDTAKRSSVLVALHARREGAQ